MRPTRNTIVADLTEHLSATVTGRALYHVLEAFELAGYVVEKKETAELAFAQAVDREVWKALTTSGLPNWIDAAFAYRELVDRVDSGKSITLELKERLDKADALLKEAIGTPTDQGGDHVP